MASGKMHLIAGLFSSVFFCMLNLVAGLDDITFVNPPSEPVSDYPLRLRYSCSSPAVVHLEALVTTDTGTATPVYVRRWSCVPGAGRLKAVRLLLPDRLVYRADWMIARSDWLLGATLRAWLSDGGSPGLFRGAEARVVVHLTPLSPFSRPLKQHPLCPRWDVELLWRIHGAHIPQCPQEQETDHFLSSLFASTGEKFGITRILNHYEDNVLEYLRLKAISFPWCLFSSWLFLTSPCRHRFCGVLYHVDSQRNYSTPALFLTQSGQLHVQVAGKDGASTAFLSQFHMPLYRWCRIDLHLYGRAVNISMMCVGDPQGSVTSTEHVSSSFVYLDDTDGYFTVGGSKYVHGAEGFYGPFTYYRNRIPSLGESEAALPDAIRAVDLTGWFQSCQRFQEEIYTRMRGFSLKSRLGQHCGAGTYGSWADKVAYSAGVCEPWEAPSAPHRRVAVTVAQALAARHGAQKVQLVKVGRTLYTTSLHFLTKTGLSERKVRLALPRLLQASCLGDVRALYMSSALYNSGVAGRRQTDKARLLGLLAAQQDWRLALLSLGHLHHLGDEGIPPEPWLAYAYYSNMAAQTSSDRQNPSAQQKFVEVIYLNNEETLKLQTNENDDLFLWLKLQARGGDPAAEQAMGRMLFWGQQGVSPDVETAVKHYERGAVRLGDPVSMYDYAIVLLRGQGVKQDISRAFEFLKKAADQDFVPAISALGWYYEHYQQDYKLAVELWEKADGLGSPEAAFNLGVLHSQGLYPGKAADQFMAYTYYLKSAQRRHIDGAVHLAEVWIKGIPGQVKQLPLDAVLWTKWVSEQNGYLGAALREALDAYLQQDWTTAAVRFLMAAESGFTVAQFNMAYFCEQNPGGVLDAAFVTECMWRYYNLSIQSQDPSPYALVRMGDLFYTGHRQRKGDVSTAIHMYKQAALKDHPQGWYSLGLLVQEGETLPTSLLDELKLKELHGADHLTVLSTLYHRCREDADREAYLPCSLALFHAHTQSLWKQHSHILLCVSAVATAAASLLMLLSHLSRPTAAPTQNSEEPSPHRLITPSRDTVEQEGDPRDDEENRPFT